MKTFKLVAIGAVIGAAALAGVAALVFLVTPDKPGWEFTHWDMTAKQVVAASHGKIGPRDPKILVQERVEVVRLTPEGVVPPDGACSHRLLEPLTVGNIVYDDVRFCFSKGRLRSVVLLSNANVFLVATVLEKSLGAAVEAYPAWETPTWTFVDHEEGNALSLTPRTFDVPKTGSMLVYTPIDTAL